MVKRQKVVIPINGLMIFRIFLTDWDRIWDMILLPIILTISFVVAMFSRFQRLDVVGGHPGLRSLRSDLHPGL